MTTLEISLNTTVRFRVKGTEEYYQCHLWEILHFKGRAERWGPCRSFGDHCILIDAECQHGIKENA